MTAAPLLTVSALTIRFGGLTAIEDLSLEVGEGEVLALIAEGRTNAAVAQQLVLSQHAVEKHINSIFSKLNLSGDQELHPRVRATLMYLAEGRN